MPLRRYAVIPILVQAPLFIFKAFSRIIMYRAYELIAYSQPRHNESEEQGDSKNPYAKLNMVTIIGQVFVQQNY